MKPGAWILVTGDFRHGGGQDRANYELAWHLSSGDVPVHLVAHHVEHGLRGVTTTIVPRPLGSHLLGEGLLERAAIRRRASMPGAILIGNGGNCRRADVCWIHMVHAAAERRSISARIVHARQCSRERAAVRASRLVVVNSDTAGAQLVARVGATPGRVRRVYLGTDPSVFRPPSWEERMRARASWALTPDARVIGFVGALGRDALKGIDTFIAALRQLPNIEALVVGSGAVEQWQAAARDVPRIRFVGATSRIAEVLAAIDVLVSPTRYDAYGLAVHEALCRGVPAIVSHRAGITERYPEELAELVIRDPDDPGSLAHLIRGVLDNLPETRRRVAALGEELRRRSWSDMARDIERVILDQL